MLKLTGSSKIMPNSNVQPVADASLTSTDSPSANDQQIPSSKTRPSQVKTSNSTRSFFRRRKSEPKQNEDVGMSFFTLHFTDAKLEHRFAECRTVKYRQRLRFGAGFTAFFIPLLVAMQVSFKNDSDNKWLVLPLVTIFPGVVFFLGLLVTIWLDFFQRHHIYLAILCLLGQISALMDTTAAGTEVSERNVWVQFIFSLGITSSTGLKFAESLFVLSSSSIYFVALSWYRYATADNVSLSSPGTSMAAVLLYSILLAFLSWNWELEERRDYILTERLAKENVMVHMTMEMTGWFSGGAQTTNTSTSDGVLSANAHIDPDDVELKDELGMGTFGVVYSALWKQTDIAVKKLTLQGDVKEILTNFGKEANVMAQLRHPNIVMFIGVMVNAEFLGLVMELCPKGSLYSIIHSKELKLDWSLLLRMLLDCARGMHFLHTSHPVILHRDLKSLNILIDADWRCKVSDFGLSHIKAFRESQINHSLPDDGDGRNESRRSSTTNRVVSGTAMWLAPEIFQGDSHSEYSDIYSFGIILYEILTFTMPFDSITQDAVPFVVQSGKRPTDFHPIPPEITHPELKKLVNLMEQCWDSTKSSRPIFSTIISVIRDATAKYIDIEPWEDHIKFPNRKNEDSVDASIFGLSIKESDLVLGDQIGKGVFGAVFKGTYFGTQVAIKKLFINGVPKDALKDFNKECEIMKGLHHPNIVLFMGSCCNHPTLLLVTELLSNGSFFDIYHKRSKPDHEKHMKLCINLTVDMARGLAYLHNHDPVVIHRDLKSQNIMLDETMKTKIGDFGLSKFREVGKTMSICGSPLWVAPEVLRGEKYDCACDVYSFAIIVWECLAWSEPYPNMGSTEVMNGVACGTLRPTAPDFTPPVLSTALKKCWSAKPRERPTFNDLIPVLEELRKDRHGKN